MNGNVTGGDLRPKDKRASHNWIGLPGLQVRVSPRCRPMQKTSNHVLIQAYRVYASRPFANLNPSARFRQSFMESSNMDASTRQLYHRDSGPDKRDAQSPVGIRQLEADLQVRA